jgi:hypothetical protein
MASSALVSYLSAGDSPEAKGSTFGGVVGAAPEVVLSGQSYLNTTVRQRNPSCSVARLRIFEIAGAARGDGADLFAPLGGAPDRREIFDTSAIALTTEDTVLACYVFALPFRVDGAVVQLLVEGVVVKLGQLVERGPRGRQMFPLGNIRQPLSPAICINLCRPATVLPLRGSRRSMRQRPRRPPQSAASRFHAA